MIKTVFQSFETHNDEATARADAEINTLESQEGWVPLSITVSFIPLEGIGYSVLKNGWTERAIILTKKLVHAKRPPISSVIKSME